MSSSVYIPSTSGGGGSTPPTSISIKTASYTIPAGKYAVIRNLHGDLTVNGVEHYTILNSFNRVISTNISTTDVFYPDQRCDFIKVTRTHSASNSSNLTRCDTNILTYFNAFLPAVQVTTNASSTALYYSDSSFAGTRVIYFNPLNLQTDVTYGGTTAFSGPLNGLFGLSFFTARASGTITHTGLSCSFSKEDFLVPSGTVLDGVRYAVTEYTV
jgi:hypothetical protein